MAIPEIEKIPAIAAHRIKVRERIELFFPLFSPPNRFLHGNFNRHSPDYCWQRWIIAIIANYRTCNRGVTASCVSTSRDVTAGGRDETLMRNNGYARSGLVSVQVGSKIAGDIDGPLRGRVGIHQPSTHAIGHEGREAIARRKYSHPLG
jgi:hypothetical protein